MMVVYGLCKGGGHVQKGQKASLVVYLGEKSVN